MRQEVINQKWLCPFTCPKQMLHQQVLCHPRQHRLRPWQYHNRKIPRQPQIRWVQRWIVNIWCKHSAKLSIDTLVLEVGGVFLYVNPVHWDSERKKECVCEWQQNVKKLFQHELKFGRIFYVCLRSFNKIQLRVRVWNIWVGLEERIKLFIFATHAIIGFFCLFSFMIFFCFSFVLKTKHKKWQKKIIHT